MSDLFVFNGHATGCLESEHDLRDYAIDSKIAMSVKLPESYEIKRSPIKNQGSICSCVAHSVASVLEAMNHNEEKYSTNWIYGYRPRGYIVCKGMSIRQAIKTVTSVGYILYDDFKGNDEMLAVKEEVDNNLVQLKEKAKHRKAFSYGRLHSRVDIKRAIYLTESPVVISVHCCDPFETDENNILMYSDKFQGYHAMVCYGWNEYGLLIQNSWGEEWADGGCCILPDEYPFMEAWVIADSEHSYAAVKPKIYWLRKILQKLIDLIKTKE